MIKRIKFSILAVFLLFTAFINVLLGGVGVTYAAENKYSNVLDDLCKDETFDFNDYPNVDDDYSLQVIQIAESTDGELFLYVYQPAAHSKQLTATAVNMALSENVDGTALFNLTLLNREGVLQKYRVDGVKVSSDEVRYYNITSIYRDWVKGIDEENGTDNTTNSVAFEVGKLFKAETKDGSISYSGVDIVLIINPFVKFRRYYEVSVWSEKACDAHYVAFSTDYDIKELLEADVSYSYRTAHKYHKAFTGNVTDYSDFFTDKVTLYDSDRVQQSGGTGFLYRKDGYDYSRIQSSAEFLAKEDVDSNVKSVIEKTQWVLRFFETDYEYKDNGHDGDIKWTEISEVSILRLKFKNSKGVFNLGAVSDEVTGNHEPDNPNFDFWGWLCRALNIPEWAAKLIVYGIGALLILSPVLMILSFIFPVVGTVLKAIFKGIGLVFKYFFIGLWYIVKYLALGIWYVVSLPFRGIAALVHKVRGD